MSLALETAGKGITVNNVTPGFIGTGMIAAVPAVAAEKIVARIPAGRLGEPDEVARVVEFLAESSYITGRVVPAPAGVFRHAKGVIVIPPGGTIARPAGHHR